MNILCAFCKDFKYWKKSMNLFKINYDCITSEKKKMNIEHNIF